MQYIDAIRYIFRKIEIKILFFYFYFLKRDFSFTIMSSALRLIELVDNIHLEGTMSQIFDLGPTFFLCQKTGNFSQFFAT